MVEFCTCPDCPLYPIRFGRPGREGDYEYQPGDETIPLAQMKAPL